MEIQHKCVTGKAIQSYIRDLARLRMEIFRDFPYLYEGSAAYEENYLSAYLKSEDTIIVLILDGSKVVGASSGLPLEMETQEVKQPFSDKGISPAEVFYFGESLLMKAYRGRGLGHLFFDEREAHARRLNRFRYAAFFAVQRPGNHPLRPDDYRPLDAFWTKRGYRRRPDLTTTYSWKDIDQPEETLKPMMFWMREL